MVAHSPRVGRATGLTAAGLLVAASMLLVFGPHAAPALVRSDATWHAGEQPPSPATPSPPSGSYRVIGLGDSVPAGAACDCTPYVSLVGTHEAARKNMTATVANLAENGLTTSGLLTQLNDPDVGREVAAADLVIITVGANDFDTDSVADEACSGPGLDCFQPALKQQAPQLSAVFGKVNELLDGRSATVVVTGYWNVFLDGDVAADLGADYVHNSTSLTLAENAQIAASAQGLGATYVDIYAPFKGASGTDDDTSLLADDGDHPNATGHHKIADAMEAVLATA
ncbi:SGNH/GDSL hydrolase family protein [Krasilnikovia sp. MM14-A1259]|uniref:SGNH/GDSL hydrolase family protein n=1 Tax=Krasilnikovia sp. MM14-A1259 TaxID=3373539 RepID=UPI0037F63482